ncbi:45 kDa calcium-binding protein [Rhincodon typus]|uniref:45 kDa calcium-binding protein n=1 Tax=Rhincodon typus TaxID=259920 RepID=UPI00202E8644|nr:45 kDa calcium-binding protein [Rhincodon typus]
MASGKSVLCGVASLYLSGFCIFLMVDVYARPTNNSAVKREKPGAKLDDNEIQPPNHLSGLKLEKGGVLNKDFHQEVFLGKEMDEFEADSEPVRNRKKLIAIFEKWWIDSGELREKTIQASCVTEFTTSTFLNLYCFYVGQVSWDEYRIKFLASKGFNEEEVAEKIKNNEELKIDEETQELLDNLKDRWFQADEPPANHLLNEEEFLAFLHPEHSRGMLKFMVKEIIRDLDQDGDKRLTVSEFISLPVGTVENQEAQDIDDDWVKERRKEFEEVIDADRDGIVTMEELEEYMDPMNEYSALNEAKQMIAVADENQDHYLELVEILKYSEYFTGSKLMNYAQSVHEEF